MLIAEIPFAGPLIITWAIVVAIYALAIVFTYGRREEDDRD